MLRWVRILALVTLLLTACAPVANQPELPDTGQEQVPAVTLVATELAPAGSEMPADTLSALTAGPSLMVTNDPVLGPILVDGKGMTLYMFTKDGPNQSNCSGVCLEKWPPFLLVGEPTLSEGIDQALVGETTLPDGRAMVTYNGLPLYYWFEDLNPGETKGQGVNDVWFVVAPNGEPVGIAAAAPAETVEPTSPPATATATATATPNLMVAKINVLNDSLLGPILVDGKGMTLYIYTKDGPNQSNCSGECLDNWPPLLTEAEPILGEGVDPSMVGILTLADGKIMVTYSGMPLYYWALDQQPGDTGGQGRGQVWYVVSPTGSPVGIQSSAGGSNDNSNDDMNDDANDDNYDDGGGSSSDY